MKSNNEHVLVPKKPTPDMILAALVVIGMGRVNGNIVDEIED